MDNKFEYCIGDSEKQLRKVTDKLNKITVSEKALNLQNQELKNGLNEKDIEIIRLEKRLKNRDETIRVNQESFEKQLDEALASKDKEIEEVTKVLQQTQAEYYEGSVNRLKELDELNDGLSEKEGELAGLKKELAELKKELAANEKANIRISKERTTSYKERLNKARTTANKELASKDKVFAALKKEHVELEKKFIKLEKDLTTRIHEINETDQEVIELKEDLKKKDQDLKKKDQEILESKKAVLELDKKIELKHKESSREIRILKDGQEKLKDGQENQRKAQCTAQLKMHVLDDRIDSIDAYVTDIRNERDRPYFDNLFESDSD